MEKSEKIEDHPQYQILKNQWDINKDIRNAHVDFENFFFYKIDVPGVSLKVFGGK